MRVAMCLRMLAAKLSRVYCSMSLFSALDEHVKIVPCRYGIRAGLWRCFPDFHNPVIFVSHNRDEVYPSGKELYRKTLCGRKSGMLSAVRDDRAYLKKDLKAISCGLCLWIAGTACGLQQEYIDR